MRTIEILNEIHRRNEFTCGNDWLDNYIRQHALRNQQRRYGKTYVLVSDGGGGVIDGYYSISMSSVQFENLPDELLFKNMPKYPMPVAHLACLAISSTCQRQRLGSHLLMDAFHRILLATEIIGARAVDVKAIDEAARDWYGQFGFLPFKDLKAPPFHLYLPMDTVREIVRHT